MKMKGRRKFKVGGNIFHHACNWWPYFRAERSKLKVTRVGLNIELTPIRRRLMTRIVQRTVRVMNFVNEAQQQNSSYSFFLQSVKLHGHF